MIYLLFIFLIFPLCILYVAVSRPTSVHSQASNAKVDAQRMRKNVSNISRKHYPRNYRFPGNLKDIADYIADHFAKAGGQVYIQEFETRGETYRNVIAVFGIQKDEKVSVNKEDYEENLAAGHLKPHIVVGAHYDASGDSPGADDNASGVAGLIELGYLLGQEELSGQVELVAYCLEEPPFFRTPDMGSYHHAALLKEHGVDLEIMICLEMIGYFTDEENSQSYPAPFMKLYYPSKGNFIALVGKLSQGGITKKIKGLMTGSTELPVYSLNAPSFMQGVDYSDHSNYWHFGYQAVMVTDTAFYRNLQYHTYKDRADRLDYQRASMVVVQVYEAVKGLL
ncbi:MAG: M28 family peptidase [Desulfobulbaceae bacterium]|nr:M28 family peptidase [Desulfobulbaceae bacterium]